jgi:hypothetical protein
VLVEIIDDGSGFERDLRRTDFWQIGGWGLGIVDDLASRWGVREGTAHVWFELEHARLWLANPTDEHARERRRRRRVSQAARASRARAGA